MEDVSSDYSREGFTPTSLAREHNPSLELDPDQYGPAMIPPRTDPGSPTKPLYERDFEIVQHNQNPYPELLRTHELILSADSVEREPEIPTGVLPTETIEPGPTEPLRVEYGIIRIEPTEPREGSAQSSATEESPSTQEIVVTEMVNVSEINTGPSSDEGLTRGAEAAVQLEQYNSPPEPTANTATEEVAVDAGRPVYDWSSADKRRLLEHAKAVYDNFSEVVPELTAEGWGNNANPGPAQDAWVHLGNVYSQGFGSMEEKGRLIQSLAREPERPLTETEIKILGATVGSDIDELGRPLNPFGGKYVRTQVGPAVYRRTGDLLPIGVDAGDGYTLQGIFGLDVHSFLDLLAGRQPGQRRLTSAD